MKKKIFAAFFVALLAISATVGMTAKTAAITAYPRPIEYRVALPPQLIWDGTLDYFRNKGFTTVILIATDDVPYDKELQKIKQMGMYPILDIEHMIWAQSRLASVPIHNFQYAFDMWKKAGWTHVASEGGRQGDLDYLKNYFSKFTFFNCDKCGIWGDFHLQPLTTDVSWETFYQEEIPYIQCGAVNSYSLGKEQGILAGVWAQNDACLKFEIYKSLLDWSYQASVGFTHFCVFFDVGPTFKDYRKLGFETIVSELQKFYPPTSAQGSASIISVRNVELVPSAPNYLKWEITYTGSG